MKSFMRLLAISMALSLLLVLTVGGANAFAASASATDVPIEETVKAAADATPAPQEDEPVAALSDAIVVADTPDVYFAIVEQGVAEDGDYFWTLNIENRTAAAAMFTMEALSLDGLGADPSWGVAVDAGATVEEKVFWTASALAASGLEGIEKATTATFRLNAYNNEDWEVPSYINELETVYFVPEEEATPYSYEPADTDTIVFDTDAAKMVVTDLYAARETNGYEDGIAIAKVVLVNKSDDSIRFEMPNTLIAGSPYKSATMDVTVPPHASTVTSFKWTFTISYLQSTGVLDSSEAFSPNIEYTLNMKVSDVDDLTVPTIAEGAFAFTR